GRVAPCTGGHLAVRQAATPDMLPTLHDVFLGGGGRRLGIQALLGQIVSDVLLVFDREWRGKGSHDRIRATGATAGGRGFVVFSGEVNQLLGNIFVRQARQIRIRGNRAVSSRAVTACTGQDAARGIATR